MNITYPATYRDRHGEFKTTIYNDGQTLSMTVREIIFTGSDFDSFEPQEGADPDALQQFSLQFGCLCSCVIDWTIAIPVVVVDAIEEGQLQAHLEIGDPTPNGGISQLVLLMQLNYSGGKVKSTKSTGFFENSMLEIQQQLPRGTHMLACINCAFSDYSPYGAGMFGGLACFRDNKDGYRAVRSKADILRVWNTMTEFVQETFHCPEFERRLP